MERMEQNRRIEQSLLKVQISKLVDSDFLEYDQFVLNPACNGSVFHLSGVLLAMDASIQLIKVYLEDDLVAVFPYFIKSKFGLTYYLQPVIAKYSGPIILPPPNLNIFQFYKFKKDVLEVIIKAIPKSIRLMNINLVPENDYLLPFNWQGFQLIHKTTFILPNQEKIENTVQSFHPETYRFIQKAKLEGLEVRENEVSIDQIIGFLKDNSNMYSDKELIQLSKMLTYLEMMGHLHTFSISKSNKLEAFGVFAEFKNRIYFLVTLSTKEFRKSNPLHLILFSAIELMYSKNLHFIDFCGLMDKGFEFFWRKFGLIPYSYVGLKYNKYSILKLLKD